MSNPGTAKDKIVPSITGNPLLDTTIRVVLTTLSAAITTFIVVHLQKLGFSDPNLTVEIGALVFSILLGAATVVWSLVQTKLNQINTVTHVINAAATGEIPESIKIAAIKAPTISEETITAALNNAEAIKNQQ